MVERQERCNRVMQLIATTGRVSIEQICEELGVSAATARRDLDVLADQQFLSRTRGGAIANPTSGSIPMHYSHTENLEVKRRIAAAAAAMVRPGMVVGLNGGTTTTELARQIGLKVAEDPAFSEGSVTLVTNAINIANEMVVRPQLRVVVTGGTVQRNSFELIGPLTDLIMPSIEIDLLFLGVVAIDAQRGIFNSHEGEAQINAALVRASQKVVVVADASKFGRRAFSRICGIDAVHLVLAGGAVDLGQQVGLQRAGAELMLV